MHPQVQQLLVSGRKCAKYVAPIAALATRLAYGHAYVLTGLGKWRNLEKPTQFFAELGIPFPSANAVLVATIELVGGACLILGLGTRLCAALLSCTMVVALMTGDRAGFVSNLNWSGDLIDTEHVTSFVFLLAMLWLVGYGGGPASVDAAIARNLPKEGS